VVEAFGSFFDKWIDRMPQLEFACTETERMATNGLALPDVPAVLGG
jgi:hypothetical protein